MFRNYYLKLSALAISYSIWIVASLHTIGIVGLLSPFQEYFRLLTPFNLFVSAWVLWVNHHERKGEAIRFCAFVFFFGFLVEAIGVRYGFIFGQYVYGQTLGPRLLNVPVIIGLNWLLVMYCVASLTDSLRTHTLVKVVIASLLAVAIDWLIEPVAMHFDFWTWKGGQVPVQNYIGWFFTSLIMQASYHIFKVKSENKLALPFYFTQLFFFLILNVAVRY